MYYTDTLEAFLMPLIRESRESEVTKARQIVDQLNSSIDWLKFEASKQTDYQEKAQLRKEITAAEWERDRLSKEINKVNNE